MTGTEAIALGLAVAFGGGWLILVFLISKLYEWNYPAPFWRFIERLFAILAAAIEVVFRGIVVAAVWVVTRIGCLIGGHAWKHGPMRYVVYGAYRRYCLRCDKQEFRTA